MIKPEEIKKAEQTWLVLLDLFGDLNRREIQVNVAPELRLCKNLIYIVKGSSIPREKDLQDLKNRLEQAKYALISAALKIDETYAKKWLSEFDRASRGELGREVTFARTKFVPGLPRDPAEGWARLTLSELINEECVEDIVEHFGVIIEFQDDFHVTISGKKESVKKAIQELSYYCGRLGNNFKEK